MKHPAIKLTAILLTTVMVLSTFAVIANAQGSNTPANDAPVLDMSDILDKTEAATKIGDDTTYVENIDVDSDGTEDTLKVGGTTTDSFVHAYSYDFSDVPLDTDSQYVISFTLKKYGHRYGSFLWLDADKQYGFRIASDQSANLNQTTGSWVTYESIAVAPKKTTETIDEQTHTCIDFKMIVDGAKNIITLMVLTEQGFYEVINTDVFDISEESNLCLTFGALNQMAACFADVTVYRKDATAPLVDMSDMVDMTPTKSADTTTISTVDVDGDETDDAIKVSGIADVYNYVSYNFSNLTLDTDSYYEITFTLKKANIGYATALWIDSNRAYGLRFTNGWSESMNVNSGGTRVQYAAQSATPVTSTETIEGSSNTCVRFRMIVDGPNDKVRLMVLTAAGYKEVNTDTFDLSTETNLRLSFGVWADKAAYFTDVSVTGAKTATLIDGSEATEIKLLGDKYTLPTAAKAGYVFNGWRVNGGEEIIPAGTAVPTVGLETIEAVYTQVMSKHWYQFKDNGDGTKDIRIVSVIDSLYYESIGYTVTTKCIIGGEEKSSTESLSLKHVYNSLTEKYGTEMVTLESLGFDENGGYLTAFVIRNVRTDIGNVTFELTPYQVGVGETEPTTGTTVSATFDVANETTVQ